MFKESAGKKPLIYVVIFIISIFSIVYAFNKQPYTEGIFWQVSKDGEVLGHIYGTIHMIKADDFFPPDKAQRHLFGQPPPHPAAKSEDCGFAYARVLAVLHEQCTSKDGAVHRNQGQKNSESAIQGRSEFLDNHLHELHHGGNDCNEGRIMPLTASTNLPNNGSLPPASRLPAPSPCRRSHTATQLKPASAQKFLRTCQRRP